MTSMNNLTKLGLIVLLGYFSGMPAAGQGKKRVQDGSPRVTLIAPLGLVAGQTSKVAVRGNKLESASTVKILDDKGSATIISKGKVNAQEKKTLQVGDTQIVVEVTLKRDLPREAVQLVVVTPEGETKPHDLLVETNLPVVRDKEPNDGFRQAQKVELPVVVSGAIDRPRDVDVFQFTGKAGQHVMLEVLAARHGSALDSILTIYNSAGEQIATNDDTKETNDSRLAVILPADDTYFVVLMDAHDSGSPVHVYWLLMK
jgi:hypothetical protein